MPFTEADKTRLFDKLEEHSITLGKISTKLNSGDKKFKTLMDTRDWCVRHRQHHKTMTWVVSAAGSIVGTVGALWVKFRSG